MSKATNPAVQALLEEIAKAKIKAEERRKREDEIRNTAYGVIKQAGGSVILRLPPEPVEPQADECCNSGCTPCILDTYWDRLKAHKEDVKALEAQYERVLNGEEFDLREHHIRNALPGGLLDPLKFTRIKVMHVDRIESYALVFVLEATARDFVLSLGEHIHIRALVKRNSGEQRMATRPFTPVMIEAADGVVRPHMFIRLYEGNEMSEYFQTITAGQAILVRGPVATQENITRAFSGRLCILVAGGSGIAPIFQLLQFAHVNSAYSRKRLVVVHCAHNQSGLWLTKYIAEMAKELERLSYFAFLSHEPLLQTVDCEIPGANVRHERLTAAALQQALEPFDFNGSEEAHAIICGPGLFNNDVGGWLQNLGVNDVQML
ncbi:hypothetical protein BX070DRAFT_221040 [Coemansia spiralis]|nr:hypothetical protein BX070DRAFT_221040 [Coemansia spiralis]